MTMEAFIVNLAASGVFFLSWAAARPSLVDLPARPRSLGSYLSGIGVQLPGAKSTSQVLLRVSTPFGSKVL